MKKPFYKFVVGGPESMNLLVIHALRQCYYVSEASLFVKKFNFSGNFLRVPQEGNNVPVGGNYLFRRE